MICLALTIPQKTKHSVARLKKTKPIRTKLDSLFVIGNKTKAENIVISDARFVYEIEKVRDNKSLLFNYKVTTVSIVSTRSPKDSHVSENHLENYTNFDFVVENNKSLTELYVEIDKILNKIK